MFSYCLLPVCEVAVVCLMINDSTESVNKHIFESVDVVMELWGFPTWLIGDEMFKYVVAM